MVLAVVGLLGPLSAKALAQPRPPINPGLGLSLNPYVNPFMAGALVGPRNVLAGAGLTHPLAALSGAGLGWNSGLGVGARFGAMNAFNNLGYGSLMGPFGGGGFGAYGGMGAGLESGALMGAGYGYGYGLGMTQWMQNPYEGYLQGAADITRANAEYYKGIQQAKMTRQEAIRSSLETRRAMIEEAEWERAHMPDPEKIRQAVLERELNRARVSPPLNDVWSARALNSLLRHLVTQQADGVRGPNVPLNEDIVNHVNVKVGDSVGNVGLLKNGADLDWPESLLGGAFKEGRERINSLMHTAYKSVASGNNPDPATLNDLQDQYRKQRETLENNVSDLKPDEYIEAQRFLREVGQTITALKDPNIGKQFNDDWKPKARNVAELVKHMREKGLMFAPATEKDQPAYVALYHALAAFDAGMPRGISGSSGNNSDNADNK
jgi:hypothetical protein